MVRGLNALFSSPLYPQLKAALNSGNVELAASIYRSITGAGAAEALREMRKVCEEVRQNKSLVAEGKKASAVVVPPLGTAPPLGSAPPLREAPPVSPPIVASACKNLPEFRPTQSENSRVISGQWRAVSPSGVRQPAAVPSDRPPSLKPAEAPPMLKSPRRVQRRSVRRLGRVDALGRVFFLALYFAMSWFLWGVSVSERGAERDAMAALFAWLAVFFALLAVRTVWVGLARLVFAVRRAVVARAAGAYAELRDFPWDRKGARFPLWSDFFDGLGRLFWLTFFGVPALFVALEGKDDGVRLLFSGVAVVLFVLWVKQVAGCFVRFFRAIFYGGVRLEWERFPLRRWDVAVRIDPGDGLKDWEKAEAILRCIREGRMGDCFVVWESRVELPRRSRFGKRESCVAEFSAPAQAPGSALSSKQDAYFWELEFFARRKGLDFRSAAMVPVYR